MNVQTQSGPKDEKRIFVVNPASHSGKGKQLWDRVEEILKAQKTAYEAYFSTKSGEIAQIVRHILTVLYPEGPVMLVILGGDGTVNEALQGIVDFERVRVGYIPTGSGNDLARNLGIGKDPVQALDRVLSGGREMCMDLGRVRWRQDGGIEERRFLIGCGMGFDAAVCQEVQASSLKGLLNRLHLGRLTYLGIGLKQMFTIGYIRAQIRLDGEKFLDLKKMLFAVSMSHRYEGGGFCFCPQADPQDGLLDICVVDGVPRWEFPIIIPFALKGRHGIFPGVAHYRARRVEIRTLEPVWIQTDGEVPVKTDRIEIGIEKQKLHFIY